ncbi:MAG: DUF4236 domain-containing protein [Acidobacteriota bacterium]
MGLRFRRTLKLIPGVRLNVGLRGASVSIGGQVGRVTIGTSGTTLSTGIPGTGISFQQKLTSSDSARRTRRSTATSASCDVTFGLDERGRIDARIDGQRLSGARFRQVYEQNQPAIEAWLSERVREINQPSLDLHQLHLSTPPPQYRSAFRPEPFAEPRPERPILLPFAAEKPTAPRSSNRSILKKALSQLFEQADLRYRAKLREWTARKAVHERQEKARFASYEASMDAWRGRETRFNELQAQRKENYESKIRVDEELMSDVLSARWKQLDWPFETNISFDIAAAGRNLTLDIDLPEIEDLPQTTASLSADGRRLLEKSKSRKQIRQEYARHIHAVGFRLIGEAFSTLPGLETIILSAYSQRLDTATGKIDDDYLYSVEVALESFSRVDFSALERVDPIEALSAFEIRRRMTKTGVFRPIEPFAEPR